MGEAEREDGLDGVKGVIETNRLRRGEGQEGGGRKRAAKSCEKLNLITAILINYHN